MTKQIILATLNARYTHCSLALRYLYANLQELQKKTDLLEFTVGSNITDIAEKILKPKPEIVGLSVSIWNAADTEKLINLLKKLSPDTHIVLGGPEVSHFPLRLPFEKADHIIQGEGEAAFYELCLKLLSGTKPVARFIQAKPAAISSLRLPYDYYTEQDIKNRFLYVEASRGCPFHCEFCLSSLDKTHRIFPVAPFLEALEKLWGRGARTFKFIDRTFNAHVPLAQTILDFFLQKSPPFLIHLEVIPEHFPESIKQKLSQFKAGTLQLEIGLQTLNVGVAEKISRRMNLDRILTSLSFLINQTRAHIHLDLILGLPYEDIDSFAAGLNTLVALNPQEIQLGTLKLLSGTAIERYTKDLDMLYSTAPPYELLCNKHISFFEMQKLRRMTRYWDLFYNSGNFKRTLPCIWKDSSVFDGFYHFSTWLYEQSESTWKISLERLTEYLYRYLIRKYPKESREIRENLIVDTTGLKGRRLPACLHKNSSPVRPVPPVTTHHRNHRQNRHLKA